MSDDFKSSDPFGFFRNLWKPMESQMQNFMPPLTEEELDRRITELKTIEHWLNMQLGMLQMSIKTLELQKTGLSAMKRMDKEPPAKPPGK
ncbi:PhaM family polyhydroxyalkanoate granule multifunctional regulatory protein [Parachitinimonas caeni]|uniref:Uncharacterized protein n=1 Tax=Parachitinimonas caeni TaxID=3031301 RepID=A0ABT7DW54_9NEIS|nr:PhaM family polyhydroxyalkanoate granule multifunctional regulatory protein [Parachitinimonas caeni]MDK2124275.1 hypothetical protein [Parachitinimonas caeni]